MCNNKSTEENISGTKRNMMLFKLSYMKMYERNIIYQHDYIKYSSVKKQEHSITISCHLYIDETYIRLYHKR